MNILVTGSDGMMGRSLQLISKNSTESFIFSNRSSLDLLNEKQVSIFFKQNKVDFIIHYANLVTGIGNQKNLGSKAFSINQLIDQNIINASLDCGISKFIFLSSSSMYSPSDNPIAEDKHFNGDPDKGNFYYALSKSVTTRFLKQIDKENDDLSYKTLVAPNIFGLHDRKDNQTAHLINSIFNKIIDYKNNLIQEIEIWGDGSARREFIFSDNINYYLIDYVIDNIEYLPSVLNIGTKQDLSIKEYYELISSIVGVQPNFIYNEGMPTGAKRKLLESNLAYNAHDWSIKVSLKQALEECYKKEYVNE